MVNPDFGKTELNESPDLSMAEITEQLFNNEFLSDIQFKIDDKILFAHSWELIKRSVVFRTQLKPIVDESKSIAILDTTYDAFYQFVRFIYTDKCEINADNRIDILKLARKYKVIKLETKVINTSWSTLKQFEYCVLEKYDLSYQKTCEQLVKYMPLLSNDLTTIHSDVLEEILKFEGLSNLSEVQLFEILMGWIKKSSETNDIQLAQYRSHYDKFIRLIRFPTMTFEEVSGCIKRHKDLLTNDDIASIFKQISFGADYVDPIWNSTPRLETKPLYEISVDVLNDIFETKFSVSNNVMLRGLRFGCPRLSFIFNAECQLFIRITACDRDTNGRTTLGFNWCLSIIHANETFLVSLGDSIELKPNIEYTIEHEINKSGPTKCQVFMRNDAKDIILSGPPDVFQDLQPSKNLCEIIYR